MRAGPAIAVTAGEAVEGQQHGSDQGEHASNNQQGL